jgi:hypothetical protein
MSKVPVFAFQTASTPDRLMGELERFIRFWLGPRREAYGEPESALRRRRLPAPLRRLYAFAGRWTRQHPQTTDQANIFSIDDGLRSLNQLERTPDGKLTFLDESSGNWSCATLPEGDDPPVWVDDTFEEYHQGKWGLVANSLSQFLVTFCLRELMHGSKRCLSGKALTDVFESSKEHAVPLWVNQPYVYLPKGYSFYLLHGRVLVGQGHGATWLAANHKDGIRFLESHQGGIRQVTLAPHGSWSLSIEPDGSAEITLPNWFDSSARAPAGTFDFARVRDQLLAACAPEGAGMGQWYASFPRTGVPGCDGRRLDDIELAHKLFRQAVAALESKEDQFDELATKFPLPI